MTSRPPRSHLTGREYLAVIRGDQREPSRPYTFDLAGLTDAELAEVDFAACRLAGVVIGSAVPSGQPFPRQIEWSTKR